MSPKTKTIRLASIATLVLVAGLASGCTTRPPPRISPQELAQARAFPYYKVYWAGATFDRHPVTATDGTENYNSSLGEGIEYGNCDQGKGLLHRGSCVLPLEIITVVYRPHCNGSLGAQRNMLLRGVPATIFDGGHSIEVYTGHLAIDVYADSAAGALRAAKALRPLNAPGKAGAPLPPPTFHPGLVQPAPRYRVAPGVGLMERLGVVKRPRCS